MSQNAITPDLEGLLVHGRFLRALAKSLLFDEHRVDDVVQQAWLAALERGKSTIQNPRSWLAAVTRNQAYKTLEREGRLAKREQAAAKPEGLPSTADFAEKETVRREVADAVLLLEEPYRSAILLRYFENLLPKQIAARLGIPTDTIYTRLRRGLEQLREKLDRNHGGDRRTWCLGLIPFAASKETAVVAAGGLAAQTGWSLYAKLAAAASLLAMVGGGIWLGTGSNFKIPAHPSLARAPESLLPSPAEMASSASASTSSRSSLPRESTVGDWIFRGRVMTSEKLPVPGAEVRLWIFQGKEMLWSATVLADGQGEYRTAAPEPKPRFSFTPFRYDGRASAPLHFFESEDQFAFPSEGRDKKAGERVLNFVLRQGAAVRGKVVDAQGAPIYFADASVSSGDPTQDIRHPTDPDGRFEIPIPQGRTSSVLARKDEIGQGAVRPFLLEPGVDFQAPAIVLKESGVLEGILIDPSRHPISGALIALYAEGQNSGVSKYTSEEGRFAWRTLDPKQRYRFEVESGKLKNPETLYAPGGGEVTLEAELYRVRVHVRDERGLPIPGASVSINRWKTPDTVRKEKLLASASRWSQEFEFPPNESWRCGDETWKFTDVHASPGDLFCLVASAPGAEPESAYVEISPENYQTDVDLVLKPFPDDRCGRLLLSLKDPTGRPIQNRDLIFYSLKSGAVLEEIEDIPDPEGTIPVPPGSYRISILPDPKADGSGLFLPIEQEVSFAAGKTTKLDLKASPRGRLRLLLRLPESQTETPPNFEVSLRAANGTEIPALLLYPVENEGWEMTTSFKFGIPGLVDPLLEPGTYTLSAHVQGFRPFQGLVAISGGKIVDQEIRLDPE